MDERHVGFSLSGLSLGLAMYFAPLGGILALLMAGVLGEAPLLAEAGAEAALLPPATPPAERND
jgi:hypothetical protein